MIQISVVVPIYNEESMIGEFVHRTIPVLTAITPDYELIFVMDPCTDQTQERVLELRKLNSKIKLIKLSRRFGQPMATLAGLTRTAGQAVVVMDCDLQDPPELISQMVDKWKKGADVVYARRVSRAGEPFIKKWIAYLGYRMMGKVLEVKIPKDTGDFRLMSRRVVTHLLALKESHGFMRGAVALLGFPQDEVTFDRPPRHAGQSRYSRYLGSTEIALNGVFGFSYRPLRFGFWMAVLLFFCAWVVLFCPQISLSPQWLAAMILWIGSGLFMGQAILGQYIARIYLESRERPKFLVDCEWGFD